MESKLHYIYVKTCHDSFLPYPFEFIIHYLPTIQRYRTYEQKREVKFLY